MIRLKSERPTQTITELRGGIGDLTREDLFSTDEACGKTKILAVLTIPPGNSIGEHSHGTTAEDPDAELYYVLTGSLRITDNGITKDLSPGDAVFTGGGTSHSVVNVSKEDASLLAVIMK